MGHTRRTGSADVPGGEPRRLFSFAEWGTPEELEGRAPYQFANTWVDESTITGAYRGVLYRAPREGGEPVVVSETLPPLEGDPLFERAVRAGDFLYSVIGEGASATLFRMPWQGGERETIRELPGWSIIDELVAGKSALYYRSSNSNQTWSFPYDGGEPQLIASDPVDRLLGAEERPYLLSRADDDDRDALYLGPSILHSGLEDGDPTAQLTLPRGYFSGLFATSHNIAGDPQIVRYDDALYFIAFGRYALPDDRRAHERPVLVRVTPDLDSLEVVRCIPPPPFDPLVPGGGQEKYEIQGITASAAGIFVLRETAFAAAGDGSVRPHAVRVWP